MIQDAISFKMLNGRYRVHEFQTANWILLIVAVLLTFFAPRFLYSHIEILWSILILVAFLHIREFFRKFDTIIFRPQLIEIGVEKPTKINYTDIQKIVVEFWAQRWEYAFPFWIRTGHENTIKIITKDGKKIIKNIRIENNVDYRRFKSLRSFLAEKGVEVKMKFKR